ncbi:Syntaxin-binding protein 4, partial [Clarias magur]
MLFIDLAVGSSKQDPDSSAPLCQIVNHVMIPASERTLGKLARAGRHAAGSLNTFIP